MRFSVMILAATAAISLAPHAARAQDFRAAGLHQAQYAGPGYDNLDDERWQRREQWRQWRRERDEARIAEAARQEAMRIEAEREERRAWRRARRAEENGGWYAPGDAAGWQRKF